MEEQISYSCFLGRGKCPPTLFLGGANVRSLFFREEQMSAPLISGRGKCPTPRFMEGQMSGKQMSIYLLTQLIFLPPCSTPSTRLPQRIFKTVLPCRLDFHNGYFCDPPCRLDFHNGPFSNSAGYS